ncbi:hypothetical protein CC78DRAFT_528246 [Lojkania enalia]|uniref:GPI anchored cell wall protein n=1 Tax=Lojkania enalia TaxID=147567 RepID=A0A9P4TR11_9PLEO|nr:hypothetical protein CC78DRAFT_528246 [Didymosphaeria enalia]
MKTFATIAALAAVASAATVTLKETACISPSGELEEFTIEVDKLVVKELESVCGLELLSADGVDVNSLTCLAYKDIEGTEVGSAPFTKSSPALISTNPVQENSIRCNSSTNANTTTTALNNGTVITSVTFVTLPSATGGTVLSGTGLPTTGGNTTVPTVTGGPTVQPSQTEAPPSETSEPGNAGSRTELSALAVALVLGAYIL